jgi:hypothetical protein
MKLNVSGVINPIEWCPLLENRFNPIMIEITNRKITKILLFNNLSILESMIPLSPLLSHFLP